MTQSETNSTNPYQAPQETSDRPLIRTRPQFVGGFPAIAGIGLVAGVIIGSLVFISFNDATPLSLFGYPFLGIFAAIFGVFCIVRPSSMPIPGRLLLSLMLAVPAYVVFIPICTITGGLTASTIGTVAGAYHPAFVGVVLASVIGVVIVLLATAGVIRSWIKVPQESLMSDTVDDNLNP